MNAALIAQLALQWATELRGLLELVNKPGGASDEDILALFAKDDAAIARAQAAIAAARANAPIAGVAGTPQA